MYGIVWFSYEGTGRCKVEWFSYEGTGRCAVVFSLCEVDTWLSAMISYSLSSSFVVMADVT